MPSAKFALAFDRRISILPAMKIACGLFTILFGLFCYWQLNDLTQYNTKLWYGWVAFYASASLISLIQIFKFLPRSFFASIALLTLAAAIYRSLSIEWGKTVLYNHNNPAGNESGGILIVSLWMGFLWWKSAKHQGIKS